MMKTNFLYVQQITVEYTKDLRYSNFAQQRQAIKFYPIDISENEGQSEIFLSRISVRQSKGDLKIYPYKNKFLIAKNAIYNPDDFYSKPFGEKIALQKSGDNYAVLYKKGDFYHKCFVLKNSQYARIIYNCRVSGFDDCVDLYQNVIFNFLQSDKPLCGSKIFYRKNPDFEYKDMKCLYR